jgi:hypothetical protein
MEINLQPDFLKIIMKSSVIQFAKQGIIVHHNLVTTGIKITYFVSI